MYTDEEIMHMPIIDLCKMWEWEPLRTSTLRIIEDMKLKYDPGHYTPPK